LVSTVQHASITVKLLHHEKPEFITAPNLWL